MSCANPPQLHFRPRLANPINIPFAVKMNSHPSGSPIHYHVSNTIKQLKNSTK